MAIPKEGVVEHEETAVVQRSRDEVAEKSVTGGVLVEILRSTADRDLQVHSSVAVGGFVC